MPVAFSALFDRPRPLVAMIHLAPSPGVPGFVRVDTTIRRAVAEAELYAEAGVDGLLIENMHDFPPVAEAEMGPEVAASMTAVALSIRRRVRLPLGVQVLFQGTRTAIAVAQAAGCEFVRAEGWTHAHVSDKGIARACAGDVVRYRHAIGADRVAILADVRKKHAAHAWTADLTLADIARGMRLHRADGLVVTGSTTGEAPEPDDLRAARAASDLPIVVGSGMTPEAVDAYYPLADAFIVGSAFKEDGRWDAPVCAQRVRAFVEALEAARAAHRASISRN